MKKKKGFTLVELLAVIVILAVILIIAMPKISDVIKNSKEASLETTAKLIASQAEKKYTENQALDNSSTIKCSDVARISANDYESCNITFDDKGNAKVTIVGRGKFEGLAIYDGTKNSASSTSTAPTDTSYFTYSEVEGGISITGFEIGTIGNVEVVDVDKCKSYLQTLGDPKETATTLCNDNVIDAGGRDVSIKILIEEDEIPSSDYETAGLKVEYIIVDNVEVKDANMCKSYLQSKFEFTDGQATTLCTTEDGLTELKSAISAGAIPPTDYEAAGVIVKSNSFSRISNVVIPSQIDGKSVVAISNSAFEHKSLISISMPDTITNIGNSAFRGNNNLSYVKLSNMLANISDYIFDNCGLDTITIPDGVTVIGRNAFFSNKLTSVTIPNSVTTIGDSAFSSNQLTSVTIPDSVAEIGASAFFSNELNQIKLNDNLITIGVLAFSGNKLANVTIPSSVTSIGKGSFSIGCGRAACTGGVCECYVASGNENLSNIVNKTGKSFDWDSIINNSTKGRYTFETGTVASDNKANWNIEITK